MYKYANTICTQRKYANTICTQRKYANTICTQRYPGTPPVAVSTTNECDELGGGGAAAGAAASGGEKSATLRNGVSE
jgi:hypothetical protein